MVLPGKRTQLYPFLSLFVVAAAAFWLGRLSVGVTAPHAHLGDREAAAHSVSQLRSGEPARSIIAAPGDTWRPDWSDWQELAKTTGLLENKPLLPVAESGTPHLVVQPYQIVSRFPRILVFPNFIDAERANQIKRLAEGKLHRSGLALRKEDKGRDTSNVRTSQGTFLSASADASGALAWLDDRISDATGVPTANFEAFNVLRYELGEHYDAHHDVFRSTEYGKQSSNRIATVLVYLEAPEEGGETIFPAEGEDGPDRIRGYNFKTCDRGYRYKPRRGDAVLFWSLKPNGEFDERSLHGGCPVVSGTKWVATKWIRDKAIH